MRPIYDFSETVQVYQKTVRDIVEKVGRGMNATVMAYGQTSSGKTHTMTVRPTLARAVGFCFVLLKILREAYVHNGILEMCGCSLNSTKPLIPSRS